MAPKRASKVIKSKTTSKVKKPSSSKQPSSSKGPSKSQETKEHEHGYDTCQCSWTQAELNRHYKWQPQGLDRTDGILMQLMFDQNYKSDQTPEELAVAAAKHRLLYPVVKNNKGKMFRFPKTITHHSYQTAWPPALANILFDILAAFSAIIKRHAYMHKWEVTVLPGIGASIGHRPTYYESYGKAITFGPRAGSTGAALVGLLAQLRRGYLREVSRSET